MPGHIVRRGERAFLVRIPMGRNASGTRIFHSRTVHGTKRDAQRYLTRVQRELDTGTFVQASQQPLGDYVLRWLEASAKPRVRSRTLADYRSLATRYLLPRLGHRRLAQLVPQEIQELYGELLEKGLAPRTIRYAHSVLHGALEQAVRWHLLARNPAKLVDLPRLERREMRALSPDQASHLLSAAEGTPYYALWVMLLTTGIRPGEALALKWADINGHRLHVQRALVRHGRTWELVEPKTLRARRVVTMPQSAMRALNAHRVGQFEARLHAGERWNDFDLVFANGVGTPLDYRVLIRRHFKPLVRRAGVPPIRPYDLRHSCATLLLGLGENVKVVSERLGHASASLTLDVYSHVLPDMQQQAADRLESLLFAPHSHSSGSESKW